MIYVIESFKLTTCVNLEIFYILMLLEFIEIEK